MVEYFDLEELSEKKNEGHGVHVQDHTDEQIFETTRRTVIQIIDNDVYDDPNLDSDEVGDYEDDSPYPEVRSAVANSDDVNMPSGTIRAWVLGLIWAIIIPGLNQCVLPSQPLFRLLYEN